MVVDIETGVLMGSILFRPFFRCFLASCWTLIVSSRIPWRSSSHRSSYFRIAASLTLMARYSASSLEKSGHAVRTHSMALNTVLWVQLNFSAIPDTGKPCSTSANTCKYLSFVFFRIATLIGRLLKIRALWSESNRLVLYGPHNGLPGIVFV